MYFTKVAQQTEPMGQERGRSPVTRDPTRTVSPSRKSCKRGFRGKETGSRSKSPRKAKKPVTKGKAASSATTTKNVKTKKRINTKQKPKGQQQIEARNPANTRRSVSRTPRGKPGKTKSVAAKKTNGTAQTVKLTKTIRVDDALEGGRRIKNRSTAATKLADRPSRGLSPLKRTTSSQRIKTAPQPQPARPGRSTSLPRTSPLKRTTSTQRMPISPPPAGSLRRSASLPRTNPLKRPTSTQRMPISPPPADSLRRSASLPRTNPLRRTTSTQRIPISQPPRVSLRRSASLPRANPLKRTTSTQMITAPQQPRVGLRRSTSLPPDRRRGIINGPTPHQLIRSNSPLKTGIESSMKGQPTLQVRSTSQPLAASCGKPTSRPPASRSAASNGPAVQPSSPKLPTKDNRQSKKTKIYSFLGRNKVVQKNAGQSPMNTKQLATPVARIIGRSARALEARIHGPTGNGTKAGKRNLFQAGKLLQIQGKKSAPIANSTPAAAADRSRGRQQNGARSGGVLFRRRKQQRNSSPNKKTRTGNVKNQSDKTSGKTTVRVTNTTSSKIAADDARSLSRLGPTNAANANSTRNTGIEAATRQVVSPTLDPPTEPPESFETRYEKELARLSSSILRPPVTTMSHPPTPNEIPKATKTVQKQEDSFPTSARTHSSSMTQQGWGWSEKETREEHDSGDCVELIAMRNMHGRFAVGIKIMMQEVGQEKTRASPDETTRQGRIVTVDGDSSTPLILPPPLSALRQGKTRAKSPVRTSAGPTLARRIQSYIQPTPRARQLGDNESNSSEETSRNGTDSRGRIITMGPPLNRRRQSYDPFPLKGKSTIKTQGQPKQVYKLKKPGVGDRRQRMTVFEPDKKLNFQGLNAVTTFP